MNFRFRKKQNQSFIVEVLMEETEKAVQFEVRKDETENWDRVRVSLQQLKETVSLFEMDQCAGPI